jgi:hypothetical protein
MEKRMCCSKKKTHIVCVVKKKHKKIQLSLNKMKRGVQDGSIHNWGTQKKEKKTLELS